MDIIRSRLNQEPHLAWCLAAKPSQANQRPIQPLKDPHQINLSRKHLLKTLPRHVTLTEIVVELTASTLSHPERFVHRSDMWSAPNASTFLRLYFTASCGGCRLFGHVRLT